jgi:hypothetical protein
MPLITMRRPLLSRWQDRKVLPIVAIAMLWLVPSSAYAQDDWQIGTAPSFSSGRYGTETSTEVLHTPITARRLFTNADLTLVFPFTCIWGDPGVTVVNGAPVRTERIDAAGTTDATRGTTTTTTRGDQTTTARGGSTASTTRTASDATVPPPADIAPATISACGLGDIVVRGRYYVLDERGWLPTIAVRGHVKTPTADASRGLGTGRPDEGIGVEISRMFRGGVMAMVDGGYTIIGQPSGVDYDNTWWYDVGVGQNFGRGAVNVSVFFSEYRAIVAGFANARDLLVAVNVKGASGWRIQLAGEKGLSDGAPDHGFTFGAARRF